VVVAVVAVAAALAGCGGGGEPAPRPAEPIPLGPLPASVLRLCDQARVGLCPRLFPRGQGRGGVAIQPLSGREGVGYLLDLHVAGFASDDAGHVILGAQPGPLALDGRAGRPWPERRAEPPVEGLGLLTGQFGREPLVVERRTSVGVSEALVLHGPPYPRGGIHGGHVVVLWNLDGHGQLVSLHFTSRRHPERYPHRARVATALAMARSTR
jgi:hypothetical protein